MRYFEIHYRSKEWREILRSWYAPPIESCKEYAIYKTPHLSGEILYYYFPDAKNYNQIKVLFA